MDPIERRMIHAIRSRPLAREPRLVYADWLENHGDPRAEFVRVELAMHGLDPDHPAWPHAEDQLSRARVGCDPQWIALIETHATPQTHRSGCKCLTSGRGRRGRARPTKLHRQRQDTQSEGYRRLLELIDEAAETGAEEFRPRAKLSEDQWAQIISLPAEIAKLRAVRRLHLYGSYLVRLHPAVAALPNLVELITYTSYCLHWYPYELRHCATLRQSSLSTRAVYGNYKNRMTFPRLERRRELDPRWAEWTTRPCSVCGTEFVDRGEHRVWISLPVATDMMPLLVNACSQACIDALPEAPSGYLRGPHHGGPELLQPATAY